MKIGIDISQVVYGTGVSEYTSNLVKNLLLLDKENDYLLFGGSLRRISDLKRFTSNLKGNYCEKILPIPPTLSDFFWNKLHILNIERLVGKIDVFHSSDWAQPPSRAFNITTVHDLVPLIFPKQSHPKLVMVHQRRLNRVIKEVDRVIVPSNTTKNDLVDFGVKEEIIRVIYEAPGPAYKPVQKSKIKKLKNAYRISGDYILAIGVNPRKNTKRIIKAFEHVKAEHNLRLVIIGHQYMKLDVPRGVHVLGHVPDSEVPILLTGAKVLVYPSLYEGFGLPILNAFACKTPVVTSKIGSMEEIAQKAAVLADPYDAHSIKDAILKAISNRPELVSLGSKRLKSFTWKENALKTLQVYNEAI